MKWRVLFLTLQFVTACAALEEQDDAVLLHRMVKVHNKEGFVPDGVGKKIKELAGRDVVESVQSATEGLAHGKIPNMSSITGGIAERIASSIEPTLKAVDEQVNKFDMFTKKQKHLITLKLAEEKGDTIQRFQSLFNQSIDQLEEHWSPVEISLRGVSAVAVQGLSMIGQDDSANKVNKTFSRVLKEATSFSFIVQNAKKGFDADLGAKIRTHWWWPFGKADVKKGRRVALQKLNGTLQDCIESERTMTMSLNNACGDFVDSISAGIEMKTTSKALAAQARQVMEPVQAEVEKIAVKLNNAAEDLLGSIQEAAQDLKLSV